MKRIGGAKEVNHAPRGRKCTTLSPMLDAKLSDGSSATKTLFQQRMRLARLIQPAGWIVAGVRISVSFALPSQVSCRRSHSIAKALRQWPSNVHAYRFICISPRSDAEAPLRALGAAVAGLTALARRHKGTELSPLRNNSVVSSAAT